MKTSKEWQMIEELLKLRDELYDDHLSFLEELNQYMDPHTPMIDQRNEKDIVKLHWLYEWKCNESYMPLSEFWEEWRQS